MPSTKNLKGDLSTTGDELILTVGASYTTTLKAPTASQANVLTLPDIASDTLVSKTSTDTLTNKTLTAAVVTAGSTLNLSGAGTFTAFANATTLTLGDGSTNVTIPGNLTVTGNVDVAEVQDDTFRVVDEGDETKKLAFSLGGATTSTTTTLTASQTANRAVTLPDADTTLAGLAVTQTFTGTQTLSSLASATSSGSNPADAGILRLANTETLAWRNAANSANVTFSVDASNKFDFNGTALSSAELGLLAGATGPTGSGNLVLATSPTLTTPDIGTPSAGTLTNCTGLPVATGISGLGSGVATFLATPSSANLITAVTDETGTGSLVFANTPTLVTPVLGTPTSGTLTNCTGLPIATGVSGLGTNVATFLATPSSANLASAVTDETGSGALVFATSPTLVTPALGVATATSLNGLTVTTTTGTLTLANSSTLATSGAYSTTLTATAATNVTLPTTGTLATLAGSETLETKTLDAATVGGAANDGTDGYLLLKDQSADPSAASGDDVKLFAKDKGVWYVDSTGTAQQVGAGTGQGELNYIGNPSGATSTTGWTNVGDVDIARTTTASELPREQTTASGLKITADANTQSAADYVYYDFDLDDVDTGRMLKIEWAQKQTGSYVAGDFEVILAAQSDRTTAIATPVVSAIPAKDGIFNTEVMTTSTTAVSLVIRATTDMATDAGIVISDVVVGPGKTASGAVVTAWESDSNITLKGTTADPNLGSGGSYVNQAYSRRVGDTLEVRFTFRFGNTGTSAGTGSYYIDLGSGRTVDGDKVDSGSANANRPLGAGQVVNSGANGYPMFIEYNTSSLLSLYYYGGSGDNATAVSASAPFIPSTSDIYRGFFSVPLTEWAGQGTMNALQQDNLSEWTEYTMTVTGQTSDPTFNSSPLINKAVWRRVGDSMEIRYSFRQNSSSGTAAGSGVYLFSIPDGYTIDTSLFPGGAVAGASTVGSFAASSSGEGSDAGMVGVWSSTKLYLSGASNGNVDHNTYDAADATLQYSFIATVPITEWAGSQSSLVGFTAAANGLPGLIDYYKTEQVAADFNEGAGSGGSTTSTTLTLTRIGNVVHLNVASFDPTAGSGASAVFQDSTVVPAEYRPESNVWFPTMGDDSGTRRDVYMTVDTDGDIRFYKSVNLTDTWTTSTQHGIFTTSVSWIINNN